MFYIMRPEGFTSATGGLLTFSSQPQWANCVIGRNVDAQTFWTDEIEPFTRGLDTGSLLPVEDFSYDSLAQYANKYYGTFISRDVVIPSPITVKSTNPVPKGKGSYKAFKAARESGAILLNPIDRYSFEGSCSPGLPYPISGPSMRRYDQWHSNFVANLWTEVPNACQQQQGEGNKLLFLPTEEIAHSGRVGTLQVYRQYAVEGNVIVPLSASDMLEWFSHFRESILDLEVSKSLVTQARAEARSGIIDLTTTLAELPETLKMIYEAIRIILAKYLECKRKIDVLRENRVNQADLVSQVTALWMQYRYGIMPNVYTIQDGLKYLDASVIEYLSVRVGERHSIEVPPWRGWVTADAVEPIERVFLKNRFDIDSVTKSTAFLKTDILSTAWELVPLSFVVDWALNIGDFLSAISAPTGSIQEAAQRSIQVKPVTLSLVNPLYPGAVFTATVGVYNSELIQPSDHIGLAFDLTLTLKRKLDALSLLWGASKSDFKQNLTKRIR